MTSNKVILEELNSSKVRKKKYFEKLVYRTNFSRNELSCHDEQPRGPLNPATMSFDSAYYLADPLEQLKPQRLDGSTFFGPLNTLTQSEFIENENIELFIGIGLNTQRLANILQGIATFVPKAGPRLVFNFDQDFNQATVISGSASSVLEQFCCGNTSLLKLFIESFLEGNSESFTQNSYRCLTPTPETSDNSCMIDGNAETYYSNVNVCPDSSSGRYTTFNDLMTIFKFVKPTSKVLVFSQNGNDADLVSFLISALLKKNPSIKPVDAYQFLKSIRPTIDDIPAEALFSCTPLMEYHDFLMTKERMTAQQGYAGCNRTPQTARKRNGPMNCQRETFKTAETTASGPKRSRFD